LRLNKFHVRELMEGYLSVEDAQAASLDQTDKALGAIIAMLYSLYLEKRNIRMVLEKTDDEEEIGDLEWKLKMLRNEESSLHRLESGLQSRLKSP
jgi:hypothetical protein